MKTLLESESNLPIHVANPSRCHSMSKAKKTYLVDDEFKIGCFAPDVSKDDDFIKVDDEDVDVAAEIIVGCSLRRTFIRLFIFNIILLSLMN